MESKRNILLLDDDKFLLDMYAMKFAHQGFNVQSSLSVEDAIAEMKRGFAPHVILFDLIMPDRDGFQFLEMMRAEKLGQGAIKIALTNQSTDAEKAKCLELGADTCITKATMIPSEVVNMVESVLAKGKTA